MLTYCTTLATSSGGIITYIPLLLTAYIEISPRGLEIINSRPTLPLAGYLKDTFTKGS